MAACLKRCDCDGLGLQLVLSCHFVVSLRKHLTALSPTWWSGQAALNFSHISI